MQPILYDIRFVHYGCPDTEFTVICFKAVFFTYSTSSRYNMPLYAGFKNKGIYSSA